MILIPKIFHRVWVGCHQMPKVFEAWGETWLHFNPGWEMRTWTETDFAEIGHLDEIGRAVNRSQISNIMRWSLMPRHGGIYIDTDFECLAPIEPILDDIPCFVARKKNSNLLMSAIYGAVKGHSLSLALSGNIHTRDPSLIYDLGSRYLTDQWQANQEGVKVFESEVFCPIHHEEVGRPRQTYAGAYGLHHWTSITHRNLGFERLI